MVWTVVVAAGRGERFGGAKQFAPLGEATVLDRVLETLREVGGQVVVVLPVDAPWTPPPGVRTATGGATRSASVRAGLALVPESADVVVVHDAARPWASPALFRAVVEAVRVGADAAVPALPVADTVKRVRGSEVLETVPRDDLVAVQTPQAFRASTLRRAHATGGEATDDAALVEAIGGRVVVVPGEARNVKITSRADLERGVGADDGNAAGDRAARAGRWAGPQAGAEGRA